LAAGLLTALPAFAADGPVLVLQNHRFSPAVLELPAGARVKIQVHNLDDAADEFESTDMNREKLIPAGGTVTLLLGPLAPGQYRFFGDFHQDTAQGVVVVK
jgi:hypothetical protein